MQDVASNKANDLGAKAGDAKQAAALKAEDIAKQAQKWWIAQVYLKEVMQYRLIDISYGSIQNSNIHRIVQALFSSEHLWKKGHENNWSRFDQ